ncbi:hypothetical protein STEG23_003476 [Scotinomys teguina]
MAKANGNEVTVSSGQDRTTAFTDSQQLYMLTPDQASQYSNMEQRVAHTSLPQDEELVTVAGCEGKETQSSSIQRISIL